MPSLIPSLIDNLESKNITLTQFIITFLSIVLLRNLLEGFFGFFEEIHKFPNFSHYIKIDLFFISVYLLVILLLFFLTKEKITKIAKTTIFFWPLILLPPILDFIISGGKGYTLEYLTNNFFYNFITFFGNDPTYGATYGLRVEILLFCILAGAYVFFKTKNWIKTIIAPIALYTIVYLHGALPVILKAVSNLLGITEYNFNASVAAGFFSPIILVSLVFIYCIYNSKNFSAMIGNLRLYRAAHYLIMALFGILLAIKLLKLEIDLTFLIYSFFLLLSVFFAFQTAVCVNDIADYRIDKLSNKTRPLIRGINKNEFRLIAAFYFGFSLLFAWLISYYAAMFVLMYQALAYIYSSPPFRLRKLPLLTSFILALCSLVAIMTGFFGVSNVTKLDLFPKNIALLILVTFTLAVSFKDLKDVKGDKKEKVWTIPVLFGMKKGKIIIGMLMLLSYMLAPVILKLPYFFIPSFLVGLVTFFLINRKAYNERYVFWAYYFYMLILGYLLFLG